MKIAQTRPACTHRLSADEAPLGAPSLDRCLSNEIEVIADQLRVLDLAVLGLSLERVNDAEYELASMRGVISEILDRLERLAEAPR